MCEQTEAILQDLRAAHGSNNKIVLDNRIVENILTNYFHLNAENLDLFEWQDKQKLNIFGEIGIIIKKFQSQLAILS